MFLLKSIPLYLDRFILYNNFYNIVYSMFSVRVNQLILGIVLCITSVDQREIILEQCFIIIQRVTLHTVLHIMENKAHYKRFYVYIYTVIKST